MKSWIVVFVSLLVIMHLGFTAELHQPGWHELSLMVGNVERWYRVYVPDDLPEHAPAVMLLHGGTQSMRKIFERKNGGTQYWLDLAKREKFLLIVPNGTNPKTGDTKDDKQRWNDLRKPITATLGKMDDVGFIQTLLDWSIRTYALDSTRIYLTGASNGGMMSYRLLLELPGRFAAAAVFISSIPNDPNVLQRHDVRPIPLLIANGTKDRFFHWNGGYQKQVGDVIGANQLVSWWNRTNQTDSTKAVSDTLPDRDSKDGCRIYRTYYPPQKNGAPLVFYQIDGGGHNLPSIAYTIPQNFMVKWIFGTNCRDAEGAELAWEFMKKFRSGDNR